MHSAQSPLSRRRPIKPHNTDPSYWGSKYWFVMKSVAQMYPDNNPSDYEREAAKSFYMSLQHLLPCEECKAHYKRLVRKYPIDTHLESNRDLLEWVKMIQTTINGETRKPGSVKIAKSLEIQQLSQQTQISVPKQSTTHRVPQSAMNPRKFIIDPAKKRNITRRQGNCKNCGKK